MNPPASPPDHDIVILADFRCGDCCASRACLMARVLARAGYRVAVLPWLGPNPAPFALVPDFAGLADCGVRVLTVQFTGTTRLLLATDLRYFTHRAAEPLRIEAAHRIVICGTLGPQTPAQLDQVISFATEALGGPVVVAPAAAVLRDRLSQGAPHQPLTDADWPPTLWLQPPARPVAHPTQARLGLMAATPQRWPGDAAALRALLPDHPLLRHDVLDCPPALQPALLRRQSAPVFHDSAHRPSPDFLAQVDALAIPADPGAAPWPPEALIALEHGAIPLLPPDLRDSFQAAGLYARPERAADMTIDLHGLPDLAADLRAAGRELVDAALSPDHLVQRVKTLIGAPAGQTRLSHARARTPPGTILSVSTNGIGMGHLTRQMAIARHLPGDLTPVFLGFSQSVAVVRQFGWVSEYLPYHTGPRLNKAYWNEHLSRALIAACAFHQARALVLDANVPFRAFLALRRARPDLPMIWVRRAMWGPGRDLVALDRAPAFDTVIEPGEIAGAYDSGPTTDLRDAVTPVGPIRLLDGPDLLPRSAACDEIGIDPATLNVLLLPGGMNNFDANAVWRSVSDELSRWHATSVVVGKWAISETGFDWPETFEIRKGFPFARWFNAFDFVVSAAGYNSFAELVGLGVPAIFVPNENPLMDRQDLRARFAERHGLAHVLSARDRHAAPAKLRLMRLQAERARLRAALAAYRGQPNGAAEAARIIAVWARSGRATRADGWMNSYFEPAPA